MADPSLTNSATGTSAVATTTATFGFTATANRLLVLIVGSDDYKTGNPSGYTLSTGCSQQTYLGHYVWWKIAAGSETSVQYTIGSASPSAWIVLEFDNIETSSSLDVSNGQNTTGGASNYTTPAVTPSTGRRFAIASMGASNTTNWTGIATWLNSYTEVAESFNNSGGTKDIVAAATLALDGDGATTTSSGATYSPSLQAKTGIILVFKVAAAGGGTTRGMPFGPGTAFNGGRTFKGPIC